MAREEPIGHGWRQSILNWPRHTKRAILVINDLSLLCVGAWAAYSLRLNTAFLPSSGSMAAALLLGPVLTIAIYYWFGLYKLVTRYIEPKTTPNLLLASGLGGFFWWLTVAGLQSFANIHPNDAMVPRASAIIYVALATLLIWSSRQAAVWVLTGRPYLAPWIDRPNLKPVLIYGAGTSALQLVESLKRSGLYQPVGFIDENPTLWGQRVAGLKVYRPVRIGSLIADRRIEEVLLALPEVKRSRRRTILKRLEAFKVKVRTLPELSDIASGRVGISDLRPVTALDLLGRERIEPDVALLRRYVTGKVVLVTGAGGSIGSELARQIYRQQPKELVLLDASETALFEIESELTSRPPESAGSAPKLSVILGSVLDVGLVRRVFGERGIDTVYHAAAYKHVPMIELNPVVGLRNNVFGTRIIAEAAREFGAERMVLISTDKAVRPTNIMGASKRLAELSMQAIAAERAGGTVFTMVRFGNVLDSSGSVVRQFRRQIENGGPVTVTHPDIIRYFMSIPEAAELVIQAGAIAVGGEVFVLDMGKAVKIDDLARSMIKHVGLTVRDTANPAGDIAVVYTGLRPGEKLYEELLISDAAMVTIHPRIRRVLEPGMANRELARELQALEAAMTAGDLHAIRAVLSRTVEGYAPADNTLEPVTATQPPVSARTLH